MNLPGGQQPSGGSSSVEEQAHSMVTDDQASLVCALESAGVGTWMTDLQTGLTRCSALNCRLFGFPSEASPLLAEAWLSALHEDDRDAVRAKWESARVTHEPYTMEYRVAMPDGSSRWVESRARFHFDGQGVATFVSGVSMDITERRQAQAALETARMDTERQRRLYQVILDNTPDLAYVFDLNHRFIYANEGLLKMWGKSWQDAIGKNCLELGYEPWHAQMHDREIDQVIATRQAVRGEVPFTGTSGRRTYDYIFVPVLSPEGKVEAVAGTTRDVTEYKESQRRRDEFLATLSHELRNPLAPLSNGVQLLKSTVAADNRPVCELMERQLAHMVRLVDDLLDVSRITKGTLELRKEPVELAEVVRNAMDTSAPTIRAAGHQLTVRLPERPVWLHGDAVRLAQVVSNLLNNAAAYTPRGGVLELDVTQDADEAVVRIRDNGDGIAADDLATIFEMFGRGASAASRAPTGLGVGLALARLLAQMHGGHLEARSAGVGRGSEFTVHLPTTRDAAHVAHTEAAPADGRRALSGRRILVVDDNVDAANTLAVLLRSMGAVTRIAYRGEEALELMHSFGAELALLDIGMPGMDGYELAQRLRASASGPSLFLVALSGWGQEKDRLRSAEAGFDEHLVKPVDLGQICALRCFADASVRREPFGG